MGEKATGGRKARPGEGTTRTRIADTAMPRMCNETKGAPRKDRKEGEVSTLSVQICRFAQRLKPAHRSSRCRMHHAARRVRPSRPTHMPSLRSVANHWLLL